jgi:type I restriction enzyme S subunit
VPQVVEGTYGAIIQHIEPHHIANLPVPRLGSDIEEAAHNNIVTAATLRCEYQSQVKEATARLFSSVGLQDITASEWHAMGRDLGFVHMMASDKSLRALNFNPRLEAFIKKLSHAPHMLLGDMCAGGELERSSRFIRVDCEPELGVKLVGQRELFWFEPEGRWISTRNTPNDIFVEDEAILVAALGTLGEHEVFCRSEFITGSWLKYAYAENILRLRSGNSNISGAFLFAFMRSETAFRCLRSMCVGTKQQVLYGSILSRLPIPLPEEAIRKEIEQLVRSAYQKRHEASRLEKEAVAMVEKAIQEGAARGWRTLSQ